jgi:Clp protease
MKSDVTDCMRAHWHGELSLWMVFFYCPILVSIPCSVAAAVAMLSSVFFAEIPVSAGRWLFGSTIAATDAMTVWWCWGTMQKSLRMLSMNKLIAAAPVFAIGFYAAMLVMTELLPLSFSSTSEIIGEVRKERREQLNSESAWERKPWTVMAQPELHRLIAAGDIGWGSARALETAINANPELTLLEIESFGGLVREENLIVDMVRTHKMDTLVIGKCASACTGVFLAGNRRYVGPNARLGFHQSGFTDRAHDTKWSIPEYESAILYRAQGVSEDFTRQALNTSYFSIWRPDVLDVKLSGFATSWWSERPSKYQ